GAPARRRGGNPPGGPEPARAPGFARARAGEDGARAHRRQPDARRGAARRVALRPAEDDEATRSGGRPMSTAAARPLVELSGVSKSYGPTRAVSGVDFDVRAGEVHALAGTNGAGKSTLIRILGGAVDDFAGRLLLDGVETRFA